MSKGGDFSVSMHAHAAVHEFMEVDISHLDRVQVELSCGHRMRVHRDTAHKPRVCVDCAILNGDWERKEPVPTREPLGEPRRGYRPLQEKRSASEVIESVNRAAERFRFERPPARVKRERVRIGDLHDKAQREAAERAHKSHARRMELSLEHLRALLEEHKGVVTQSMYDQTRPEGAVTGSHVARLHGVTWDGLLTSLGWANTEDRKEALRRKRAALMEAKRALRPKPAPKPKKPTPEERLEASARLAHHIAGQTGKQPERRRYAALRLTPDWVDVPTYSVEGLKSRTGMTWGKWLRSIGIDLPVNRKAVKFNGKRKPLAGAVSVTPLVEAARGLFGDTYGSGRYARIRAGLPEGTKYTRVEVLANRLGTWMTGKRDWAMPDSIREVAVALGLDPEPLIEEGRKLLGR